MDYKEIKAPEPPLGKMRIENTLSGIKTTSYIREPRESDVCSPYKAPGAVLSAKIKETNTDFELEAIVFPFSEAVLTDSPES